MSDKHPYISGTGGITGAINQLKKSFPNAVTADTLKKLGIAPNNESYVINILRFIGAIDDSGNRTAEAAAAFSKHDKAEFGQALGAMVKKAYKDLFALHGEASWDLDTDKLISFFRGSDKTSDLVGRRQASTFQVLSSFAGHGEIAAPKSSGAPKKSADKPSKPKKSSAPVSTAAAIEPAGSGPGSSKGNGRDVGMTVRIEVNLPAGGDKETYDTIFRSIRENLLNG